MILYRHSEVKFVLRKYQTKHDDELRNRYKIICMRQIYVYKKQIIEVKKKNFRNFLENVTKSNIYGSAYNVIKGSKIVIKN